MTDGNHKIYYRYVLENGRNAEDEGAVRAL